MDIDLNSLIDYINDRIKHYLPDESACPSHLAEAMNYAMSAGGKRIRPQLLYLSFMMLSSNGNSKNEAADESLIADMSVVDAFAVALEMIHTHSLIHDDLPALDNDTLRRGRATVHVQYDESTAILAGDALLNYAYETVAKEVNNLNNDTEQLQNNLQKVQRFLKAYSVLTQKTGVNGMLGGQGLDVELSGSSITGEQRDYIYKNKTCALIEAPLMIGGILAGACDEEVNKLEQAGESIGNAFQVQDDILDIIGDADKLGKEVNQDARNEKNTFVAEYGLEKSKVYVRDQSDKAISIIEDLAPDSLARKRLLDLINQMVDRDY